MCGICGYIVKYPSSEDKDILLKMVSTLNHRGPDYSATFLDIENPVIGIAQSRLSIIDTSINGHQPMHFNNLSIVFNGEIYNFKELKEELIALGHFFQNETDTEVILHSHYQWGELAVRKFIGMFSYVLYDKNLNKVFCYRDRAGVKPFYYFESNGVFLFSSEIKALHKHPKFVNEIHFRSLITFFKLGYIPAPLSIFQNTYKLEAGHYITYNLDNFNFEVFKYWDINDFYEKPTLKIDYEDSKNELEKLLISACKYRMISDVPVGVFLSGGYDSTLVASILQKNYNEDIKTFTIGFDDGNDEAPFAKKIANYIGTDHTELYCTSKDAKEILFELPYYFDEPFADNSAIPTIMASKLAKRSVKVALSADGGDELFAGYDHYIKIKKNINSINKIPKSIRSSLKNWSANFNNSVLPDSFVSFRHKMHGFSEIIDLPEKFKIAKLYEQMSYLPEYYLNKLLIHNNFYPNKNFTYDFGNFTSESSIPLAIDFKNFLQNDVLTKVDRASMSQNLEAREPLLDHRLIEFVCQLPYDYKILNGNSKRILKDITHKFVPKEFLNRPKLGFSPPINIWMKNDFREILDFYFSEDKLHQSGFINVKFAQLVKIQYYDGSLHYKQLIWRILQFQMWYDKWMK